MSHYQGAWDYITTKEEYAAHITLSAEIIIDVLEVLKETPYSEEYNDQLFKQAASIVQGSSHAEFDQHRIVGKVYAILNERNTK